MGTLVIVLLIVALGVQAVALGLTPHVKVTQTEPGITEIETFERRRFWSTIVAISGLILATVASLISVLFPSG